MKSPGPCTGVNAGLFLDPPSLLLVYDSVSSYQFSENVTPREE